jgi:hypothetical protein
VGSAGQATPRVRETKQGRESRALRRAPAHRRRALQGNQKRQRDLRPPPSRLRYGGGVRARWRWHVAGNGGSAAIATVLAIPGDERVEKVGATDQWSKAEKMRCSREAGMRRSDRTTCTEQQRRTGHSGEVGVLAKRRGDTGLHLPRMYYGSRRFTCAH